MASPSRALKVALVAEVPPEWWPAKDDATVLADLRALKGSVDNPVTEPPTAPVYLDGGDLLGSLSMEQLQELNAWRHMTTALGYLVAQNHDSLAKIVQLGGAVGELSGPTVAAVLSYVTTPVPDPSWTAQVPWEEATFGRALDVEDVAAARLVVPPPEPGP